MPRMLCARCFERGWNRPANLGNDAMRYFGKHLCDDCVQDESESAHERWVADYYGGSGPSTVQDRYQAAAEQKRRLG
jgi:hypothetical protein